MSKMKMKKSQTTSATETVAAVLQVRGHRLEADRVVPEHRGHQAERVGAGVLRIMDAKWIDTHECRCIEAQCSSFNLFAQKIDSCNAANARKLIAASGRAGSVTTRLK